MNLLKNLVRQSSQTPNAAMPYNGGGKKMMGVKNQMKGMPGGYVNGPPLKPLYSAINKTMKHLESQSVV